MPNDFFLAAIRFTFLDIGTWHQMMNNFSAFDRIIKFQFVLQIYRTFDTRSAAEEEIPICSERREVKDELNVQWSSMVATRRRSNPKGLEEAEFDYVQ